MDSVFLVPVDAKNVLELPAQFAILVTIQLQTDYHVYLAANYLAKPAQKEHQQNASLATMDLQSIVLPKNVNLILLVILPILVLIAAKELAIS